MHPLYEAGMKIIDRLRETRLQVASLSMELAQAEYQLQVIKARVERALIKQVKSERALGPTVEDRARIFTLAVNADPDYQAQLKQHAQLKLKLEQVKTEAAFLRDKLTITLAAMKATEHID